MARPQMCSLRALQSLRHYASTQPTSSIRQQLASTQVRLARCNQHRTFQSSTARLAKPKTVEQAKAQFRMGPFSIYSGLFFVACGGGLVYYFQSEKERLKRQRVREASKGVGKPRIGGPFALVDENGNRFTSDDIKGKFTLMYFGFTHCPDICPDELDKMAKMIDMVKEKRGAVLTPIFVTADPNRDSPEVIKEYLADFHPEIKGLTGAYEDIKAMCKAYRVYFSTPPHVKPGQDYLVDHSIYFYLMDPEGDFIEVIGREHSAQKGAKLINDHIDKRFGRKTTDDSWKDVKPVQLPAR